MLELDGVYNIHLTQVEDNTRLIAAVPYQLFNYNVTGYAEYVSFR